MTPAQSPHIHQQAWSRLFTYVKPYWKEGLFVTLAMALYAATETGLAAIMKPLIDGSFVHQDPQTIRFVPLALIGLFLFRGLANFVTTYGLGWIARNVIHNLRQQLFAHMLILPAHFYDQHPPGQLLSKLLYDVEQVANASSDALLTLIRDSLTIFGLLAWMIYLNGALALIILLTVPVIGALVLLVSARFRRISHKIQQSMGDISHIASEMIEGHREIKAFNAQQYEYERFSQANQQNRRQSMKLIATDAMSQPLIQLITVLGLAGVIYLATLPDMLNAITAGTFISFVTAMFMLLTPLKRLTKVNAKLQRGLAAADSIFTLLDTQSESDSGTRKLDTIHGQITYQHVSFHYQSDKPALSDITFCVEPGQTIAFVGHSGSGKTTLVSLLPRLYPITQGHILLDGVDINTIKLHNLRQHISWVSQQIVLFNDTITNNIAYGCKATVSQHDIIAAAKAAHAWEFISALPQGLDTQVGQNGVRLSGGQRQRIAIARALLRHTPILILDEATASLDTEAERHIQAALETVMHNRTTLVIAHRLSTIEKADQIIVMHQGKIVETGTHQQLLNKGQHYAELYRLQFEDH